MSCLQELLSADVGEQEQQRIEDDVQSYLQLVQKVRITTSSSVSYTHLTLPTIPRV